MQYIISGSGNNCLYADCNTANNDHRNVAVGVVVFYGVVIRIGEKVIKAINRFIKIPAL